ncbi:hypothetical protein D9615_007382 [Tricholomella constricta]|uniref:RING-type domain-containing protein n=1 Tax=Tricholomella constricta TaxID=117010 RepID=A0A8H5GYU6_9AGAR|nr:hypothetical protein D9615_007382 [Tricholomella constricta]
MSGDCSICLTAFKEPVSIPCGHIYCTRCLADHVNAPGSDDLKSTCPTCRKMFNIVTPDLTYLPKKYHPYIVPSVRRLYLDTARQADLQENLSAAQERIKKLERDQETLLRQCERHMAAARAHAEGEKKVRDDNTHLCHALREKEKEYSYSQEKVVLDLEKLEAERNSWKSKYKDLKKRHAELNRDLNEADTSNSSSPPFKFSQQSSRVDMAESSMSTSTSADISGSMFRPDGAREIRPIPAKSRMKARPRPSTPLPFDGDRTKRQRRTDSDDNEFSLSSYTAELSGRAEPDNRTVKKCIDCAVKRAYEGKWAFQRTKRPSDQEVLSQSNTVALYRLPTALSRLYHDDEHER